MKKSGEEITNRTMLSEQCHNGVSQKQWYSVADSTKILTLETRVGNKDTDLSHNNVAGKPLLYHSDTRQIDQTMPGVIALVKKHLPPRLAIRGP